MIKLTCLKGAWRHQGEVIGYFLELDEMALRGDFRAEVEKIVFQAK